MDPVSLAAAAMAFVTPFLGRVAGRGAERVEQDLGNALAERCENLLSAIRKRVKRDGYADGALKRLEKQPDEEERRTIVEGALAEILAHDHAFAAELEGLVERIEAAGGARINTLIGSGAIIEGDAIQRAHNANIGSQKIVGGPPEAASSPPQL
jgi:hypothetical protein